MSHQDPCRQCPAGYHHWRDLVRVSNRQRGSRTAVKRFTRNPIPQFGPMIMRHLGDRLVAQPGTGFDKSPAQIDILTGAQGFVEPANVTQCRSATNDRRAGHIGDAGVRNHRSLPLPEVQRRAHCLVASYHVVGLRQADDSRGNQCHGGVAEVTQQRFQPTAARHDVGVQEGDEVRLTRGQAAITRRRQDLSLCACRSTSMSECPPAKSSCLIGVDEPSSTTTIRKPRNAATRRRKP